MKVIEYLERMNENESVTFIKAKARGEKKSRFYHTEYQTTSVQTVWQWKDHAIIGEYFILNDDQPQIQWATAAGNRCRCMLIISPLDFELLYPDELQRQTIISMIDEKIK